jgi:hypothetical protein
MIGEPEDEERLDGREREEEVQPTLVPRNDVFVRRHAVNLLLQRPHLQHKKHLISVDSGQSKFDGRLTKKTDSDKEK